MGSAEKNSSEGSWEEGGGGGQGSWSILTWLLVVVFTVDGVCVVDGVCAVDEVDRVDEAIRKC